METKKVILAASTGAMDFCEILITTDAILTSPPSGKESACGATIDFFGIVRPLEDGLPIEGIDYEAHPRMAERELRAIVNETALERELSSCRLVHRIGFVPSGEISLFLRVSTSHREEAYVASRTIVEALKQRAPIWKRPIFHETAA